MARLLALLLLAISLPAVAPGQSSNTFVVGSFNVENWNSIERRGQTNQPKPQASKEAVVNVITEVRPDVLGLEEMGNAEDFAELQTMLQAKGLDYPHWEHVRGADQDRHVCLLSRFPITSRQSRTDYSYTLDGVTHPIGRGILDVAVQVNDSYSFRALVVHLKSKRQVEGGPDQATMRLEEAKLLRAHIGKQLKHDPGLNLLAMGDLNDTLDSEPMKVILGEAPFRLFALPCQTTEGYEGTHFWRFKKEWSRIDYLLASLGMSNEFVAGSAKIYEGKHAGEASDHRLIYATFQASDASRAGSATPAAARIEQPGKPLLPMAILYAIVLVLLTVVIILAVALIYTRRQRMAPKQ